MPETFFKSSIVWNKPSFSLCSIIAVAFDSPIPGTCCKSSFVALLRLIFAELALFSSVLAPYVVGPSSPFL